MFKVFLYFILVIIAYGEDLSLKERARELFIKGDFLSVVEITENINSKSNQDGYLSYLRGSSLLNLNLYDESKVHLMDAYKKNNPEKELPYKIAETLFAVEDFKSARVFFKKSIERKYKIAESLYYIGFTSQKLKDYKTAVRIYNTIEKLSAEEKKDIIQAARYQVGDIYFDQVKSRLGVFESIKKYVIPQYEKALKWDEDSLLAQEIRAKIKKIQQQYEIVLYRMRNGKETADPRYFLRGSLNVGYDDNILRTNKDLQASSDGSPFMGASFFGRYSFYPNTRISLSPELTVSTTKYISSEDEIKINDTVSITGGSFNSFEHFLFDRAASTYFSFEYSMSFNDTDADSTYGQNENYFRVELAEEFQYFKDDPTILRFAHLTLSSDEEANESTQSSFILEQLFNYDSFSTYLFLSYDLLRYKTSSSFDKNFYTLRGDFIIYSVLDFMNIAPYIYYIGNDFIDESSVDNSILGLGINLNRPIAKKLYLNIDLSQEKQSGDESSDYTSNKIVTSIDYVY